MGDSKGKSQRKKQKRFLHWLSLMSTIKSHIRKIKILCYNLVKGDREMYDVKNIT